MLPAEYSNAGFWHKPDRQPKGDETADKLYQAVGYTLSRWEEMEVVYSNLFAALVESKSGAALRAYGSIGSAYGRKQALKDAASVYFLHGREELAVEFEDLAEAFGYAAARRNEIAHGVAVNYAAHDVIGGGYYLIAAAYNTKRNDIGIDFGMVTYDPYTWNQTTYAYNSSQILEFSNRFERMGREVSNFIRGMRVFQLTVQKNPES
jgi:hypothetical protein